MRRDEPSHVDGPVTADVHPSEVQNYKDGGWLIDRDAAERAEAEAKAKPDAEAKAKAADAKVRKETETKAKGGATQPSAQSGS